MRQSFHPLFLIVAIAVILVVVISCKNSGNNKQPASIIYANDGIFTKEQADKGAEIYTNNCASCHGKDLRGTEGGTVLIGERFIRKWKDQSLSALFTLTRNTMPKTNPHSLDDNNYAEVIAFLLNANEYASGEKFLSSDTTSLAAIIIGTPPGSLRRSIGFVPPAYDSSTATIEAEWLQHRGDYGSTNYSSLDQINAENVKNLKIAWKWKTDNFGPSPEYYFKATPIMAKGILYTTAGLSRNVAAIDARTGETIWTYRYDEKERKTSVPRQNSGRGVAYWASPNRSNDRIIYITPGFHLIALDAASGQPVNGFGKNGIVDLRKELGNDPANLSATIGSTSPPVIVNDVIVVGSSFPVGLAPVSKKQIRGDVMGFDVRTGKKLWTFHTIPQQYEEGNETWEKDSWKFTGNVAAWAPLTADPELGYVYLPLEAPTGDFYGGHRPGNNLFSQSLVCLNAKTGKKVWHYQLIHHDIWDYDLPTAPVLADINVDGQPVKAVVQLTKHAFAFVFDRISGNPVWPIEERAVGKSDVPGEWTSPTQPFPTKPAPYDRQGYSEDYLVDFTPEIKKEALNIVSRYKTGALFTPVSVYNPPTQLGTLVLPDAAGGANWQGGVFDKETGILYVSSSTVLRPSVLIKRLTFRIWIMSRSRAVRKLVPMDYR